jgi:integrase
MEPDLVFVFSPNVPAQGQRRPWRRRVPLTASLAAALESHLEERVGPHVDALVFTSPMGHPIRFANFRRQVWVPASKGGATAGGRAPCAPTPGRRGHDPRRGSPKAVQTVLGPGSAAFTPSVYGHVFEADLGRLADRLQAVHSSQKEPGRSHDGASQSRTAVHAL